MPDYLDYLKQVNPGFLQPPPGPSGIASFLRRPGLNEGLIAGGLALLGQDRRTETFGQALGRAVETGVGVGRSEADRQAYKEYVESLPPQMQAVARFLRPDQFAGLMAQGMMTGPEQYTLGPGDTRFSGATPIASVPEAAPEVKAPPTTDDLTEYDRARAEGFTGTLADWINSTRAPGVTVNTGDTQATAQDRYWGEKYGQINDAAQAALGNLSALNELSTLSSLPEVYQGIGGEGMVRFKQLASLLPGVNMEGVPESQAFKALSSQMALELRNPAGGAGMPGALSDKDREFLVSMVPRLQNTPEGNALIIAARARLAQRQLDVAQVVEEYAAAHGGQLDGGITNVLRERFAATDIFGDLQARAGQATGAGRNLYLEYPNLTPPPPRR